MSDFQEQEPRQLPPLQGMEPVSGPTPQPRKASGFAIASLVLGLVSIVGMCYCFGVITAPLAIIFGILALVKKQGGTGMSITGITVGSLCMILLFAFIFAFKDIFRFAPQMEEDFLHLVQDQDDVFPAYEQDGTLPDYLKKYLESPYKEFFERYDADFYDIMDAFLATYKSGQFPAPADYGFSDDSMPLYDDEGDRNWLQWRTDGKEGRLLDDGSVLLS